jgi:peptide/nickel transport system substrate-binding protein
MNVANGPFTTDSPYYVADNGYPTFDVSAAKAAIDAYQSETGQKVSLELAVNNVPDRIQLAQLLQSMWQAIDVEITITPLDPAEVSARFSSANFQIAVRNIPTFTEPEPLLSRWFYGSSPLNFSGLVSPQLDAAFDSGRTSSDSADRVSAYQEVSRQLAATLPVLWYAHGVRGYAHSVKLTLGPDNLQNVLWYEEIGFTS